MDTQQTQRLIESGWEYVGGHWRRGHRTPEEIAAILAVLRLRVASGEKLGADVLESLQDVFTTLGEETVKLKETITEMVGKMAEGEAEDTKLSQAIEEALGKAGTDITHDVVTSHAGAEELPESEDALEDDTEDVDDEAPEEIGELKVELALVQVLIDGEVPGAVSRPDTIVKGLSTIGDLSGLHPAECTAERMDISQPEEFSIVGAEADNLLEMFGAL